MVHFNENSTADDVLKGVDLTGKRVLVTGVSAGLGLETAKSLASRGVHVVGTVRDAVKAEMARQTIRRDYRNTENIELMELDLASLANVRSSADALVAAGRFFDVIINNAGVAHPPFGHKGDGFETQMGTNHLGHFVFTNRIAPLIAPGGRLVFVASAAHRFSDVDLDDMNYAHAPYDPFASYGRSKTACILFGVEFDRRHKDRGVRATSVHPGVIRTELTRHIGQSNVDEMVEAINVERLAAGRPSFQYKSVPQGAATSVWAGFVADAAEIGGRYCENFHVADVVEGPLDPVEEGLYAYAIDPTRAKALWYKSEQLVQERFRNMDAGSLQRSSG